MSAYKLAQVGKQHHDWVGHIAALQACTASSPPGEVPEPKDAHRAHHSQHLQAGRGESGLAVLDLHSATQQQGSRLLPAQPGGLVRPLHCANLEQAVTLQQPEVWRAWRACMKMDAGDKRPTGGPALDLLLGRPSAPISACCWTATLSCSAAMRSGRAPCCCSPAPQHEVSISSSLEA